MNMIAMCLKIRRNDIVYFRPTPSPGPVIYTCIVYDTRSDAVQIASPDVAMTWVKRDPRILTTFVGNGRPVFVNPT